MKHANAMAAKLAAGIVSRGYVLDAETATNQVFPILPDSVITALKEYFAFYVWAKPGTDRSVIRLVTIRVRKASICRSSVVQDVSS